MVGSEAGVEKWLVDIGVGCSVIIDPSTVLRVCVD